MKHRIPALTGPLRFTDNDGGGAAATPAASPQAAPPPAEPVADGPMIPKTRFDEVNTAYQKLVKAQEEAARKDAEAKGEFEKLAAAEREKADKEKTRAEAAEGRATMFARRAGFVSVASGKVADPQAAYKLAVADGMLDAIEVTDEGDTDPEKLGKVVEKLVEKYPFLVGGQRPQAFGGTANGNTPAPALNPASMSSKSKILAGLTGSRTPGR